MTGRAGTAKGVALPYVYLNRGGSLREGRVPDSVRPEVGG